MGSVETQALKFLERMYKMIYTRSYTPIVTFHCGQVKKIEKTRFGYKAAFIVSKKSPYLIVPVIVKLKINKGTRVREPFIGSKYYTKKRCSVAHVVGVSFMNGKKVEDSVVRSFYDYDFIYRIGDTLKPLKTEFCTDPDLECASGIHFFDTAKEARRYVRYDMPHMVVMNINLAINFEKRQALHIMEETKEV